MESVFRLTHDFSTNCKVPWGEKKSKPTFKQTKTSEMTILKAQAGVCLYKRIQRSRQKCMFHWPQSRSRLTASLLWQSSEKGSHLLVSTQASVPWASSVTSCVPSHTGSSTSPMRHPVPLQQKEGEKCDARSHARPVFFPFTFLYNLRLLTPPVQTPPGPSGLISSKGERGSTHSLTWQVPKIRA